MLTRRNYSWPGWPLDENPYGPDFDLAARRRMVAGSQALLPYLKKYRGEMGKMILEVGPFFNPLITPKNHPGAKIFYWENDHHVLKYLKGLPGAKVVFPIFCDLNKIRGDSLLKLKLETKRHFDRLGMGHISFDTVVISHVFNYIDYKLFLMVLKDFLKKDGLIFINNTVDYGLPAFFSERRPKSIPETVKAVKETGYRIIEKHLLVPPERRHQKNDRLILVARNNEK